MERRMFLFSGLFGLLPFGRKRRQRKTQTEVGSVSLTPATIQYETRDKVGNTEELFADAEWTRPKGGGKKRVAYAFLPRDRAFTYYISGKPKIWWGACVVIQFRYNDPVFVSAISVHAIPDSEVEDFPPGKCLASKLRQKDGTIIPHDGPAVVYGDPASACSDNMNPPSEVFARQTEIYAAEAGKTAHQRVLDASDLNGLYWN